MIKKLSALSATLVAKIKAFYRSLTGAQKAKLWTLLITGMGGVAASADKIHQVPFLPGWLVNAWPVVVAADVAALKLISVFSDPNAVAPGKDGGEPEPVIHG